MCGLFGKTRGAYYQYLQRDEAQRKRDLVVTDMVKILRKAIPGIGTEKLHNRLKPAFEREGIKMGRDKLHEVLSLHGLTIRRRRKRPQTTWSKHWMKKWPNLIRDLEVLAPNQLWVSDITYLRIDKQEFAYLSLITDAYSRKIVGWALSESLTAESGPLKALKMALESLPEGHEGLIHHSDRGTQYCSDIYVSTLQDRQVAISMTEKKDPYENAVAERMNGVLKTEFTLGSEFDNYEQALEAAATDIEVYNTQYPHRSIDMLTPQEAHARSGKLKNRWKRKKAPAGPCALNEGARRPSNSQAGLIYSG